MKTCFYPRPLLNLGLFVVLLSIMTGCAAKQYSDDNATKISDVRGGLPFGLKKEMRTIDRKEYMTALEKEAANNARLIEIYHRGKPDGALKEYRILDVRPGSVYSLLGLQHSDILVAADGYVVPNPQMFWNYLRLITYFDKAMIEVRREGVAHLIQYTFTGEKPAAEQ